MVGKNGSETDKYIVTNLVKELNENNIYSIIKTYKTIPKGTNTKLITYYNSQFNNSTVADLITQNDFIIEIANK